MDNRDIFVSREDLYAMVWATPMQRLAKEFGISDVGLAKTCKKLGVPRPPFPEVTSLSIKPKSDF